MSIKITGTSIPVWQEFAVSDLGIQNIVIPAWLQRVTALDSCLPVEHSGYFCGVIRDSTFYPISSHRLASGKCRPINGPEIRQVGLHPKRGHFWVFEEECTRLFAERVPNVATILWHTHPHLDAKTFQEMAGEEADTHLSVLEEMIADGLYDEFGANGKPPTLDGVVNEEFSRILSPDDIDNNPGCMHLLITDTAGRGKTSHLNGFRIRQESRAVEKIHVGLLHKQLTAVRRWYREISSQYRVVFAETGDRHRRIVEELSWEETFLPWKTPNEKFYREE